MFSSGSSMQFRCNILWFRYCRILTILREPMRRRFRDQNKFLACLLFFSSWKGNRSESSNSMKLSVYPPYGSVRDLLDEKIARFSKIKLYIRVSPQVTINIWNASVFLQEEASSYCWLMSSGISRLNIKLELWTCEINCMFVIDVALWI